MRLGERARTPLRDTTFVRNNPRRTISAGCPLLRAVDTVLIQKYRTPGAGLYTAFSLRIVLYIRGLTMKNVPYVPAWERKQRIIFVSFVFMEDVSRFSFLGIDIRNRFEFIFICVRIIVQWSYQDNAKYISVSIKRSKRHMLVTSIFPSRTWIKVIQNINTNMNKN